MPAATHEDLLEVIELIGAAELARRLEISKVTIHFWKRRGVVPPARIDELRVAARAYLDDVAAALGGKVRYDPPEPVYYRRAG